MAKIAFMPEGKTPRCLGCGRAMKNYIPTTGKLRGQLQENSWFCDCKKFPRGLILSIG